MTIKNLEKQIGYKRKIVKVEQLRKWVICTLNNGMRVWFKKF